MSAYLADLRQSLAGAWLARSAGERRLLRFAAAVVVMMLWAYLLWHAADQRQRLQQQIEKLEYRNALATQLAIRIANPAEDRKPGADGALLPLPVLAGLNIQIADRRYRIAGTVNFDAWVGWLGDLQHGSRVILSSARIRKTSVPGQVVVEGELERVP